MHKVITRRPLSQPLISSILFETARGDEASGKQFTHIDMGIPGTAANITKIQNSPLATEQGLGSRPSGSCAHQRNGPPAGIAANPAAFMEKAALL